MTNDTIAALKEAEEAVSSAMNSYARGDLAGWELALALRRVQSAITQLEAETQRQEVDIEALTSRLESLRTLDPYQQPYPLAPGYNEAISKCIEEVTAWNLTPSKRDDGNKPFEILSAPFDEGSMGMTVVNTTHGQMSPEDAQKRLRESTTHKAE